MNRPLERHGPRGAAFRTMFAAPLVCLLASCAPEPSSAPVTAAKAPAVPSISTAPRAAAAPTPIPVEPGQAAEPPEGPRLAVDGEGLRFFNATTGSASVIPFGRTRPEVLDAVERARGQSTRGRNADCGAGPAEYATWADGLSLVFQQERFVGWGLSRRAIGVLTTASGIGPGSTFSEMDEAYSPVTVQKTTLGSEFSAGGFHGVLEGSGAQARITDMWAGVSCVAR